jgi:hypothetical protein
LPLFPNDIPGAIELDEYSIDADRTYALQRNSVSAKWRLAALKINAAAKAVEAIEDIKPLRRESFKGQRQQDAEKLERARQAVADMKEHTKELAAICKEMKAIPKHLEADELEAFRFEQVQNLQSLASSFFHVTEHIDHVSDQLRRDEIITRNHERGLTFTHCIDQLHAEGLMTDQDVESIPGAKAKYLKALGRTGEMEAHMEMFRLTRNRKRLTQDAPAFSFDEAYQSAKALNASGQLPMHQESDRPFKPSEHVDMPTLASAPELVVERQRGIRWPAAEAQ